MLEKEMGVTCPLQSVLLPHASLNTYPNKPKGRPDAQSITETFPEVQAHGCD